MQVTLPQNRSRLLKLIMSRVRPGWGLWCCSAALMSYQVAKCHLPGQQHRSCSGTVGAWQAQGYSFKVRADLQSQQSRLSGGRTQCVPSISSPRGREPLPGTAQNRPDVQSSRRAAVLLTQDSRALVSPRGDASVRLRHRMPLGQAPGACPPPAVQPCLSQQRDPRTGLFSLLEGPHVLLFSEAQEGSGGRSDPRAPREEGGTSGEETHRPGKPAGSQPDSPLPDTMLPRRPAHPPN